MNLRDVDIYFNYHTHTNRNGHGNQQATDEDYVIAAMEAGIRVLGFSEHCPYKNYHQPKVRPDWEIIPEYFSSLRVLKEKYRGKCDILAGFECEYFPEKADDIRELREMSDFIILGQHFGSLYGDNVHPITNSCTDEEAKLYTSLILAGLDTGMYDILAHPDYFYGGTDDINDTFVECSHLICRKCEETDTPLEINFNGNSWYGGKRMYKQGLHFHYPNRIFWEIASQYNIRCIIGYDAHDPILFAKKEEHLENFSPEVDDLGLNIITEPLFK